MTVPCPLGRPLKSGRTSISQASISESVAGRPRSNPVSATAVGAARLPASASAAASRLRLLHMYIGDLPAFVDLPGLNGVIVIDRARTPDFAQLTIARLHKPGTVHGPALQDNRRAIPDPIDVEACQAFVEYRGFKPCSTPVLAAVKRDIHLLDVSPAGPGQAADVIKALGKQCLPA